MKNWAESDLRRYLAIGSLLMMAPLALSACGEATGPASSAGSSTVAAAGGGEIVIYSARKEELMKPLVDAFAQQSGTKVTLKTGKPGELAQLIRQEKSSPRGDVFFTTDAATTESLGKEGILAEYRSPAGEKVPAEFKAQNGTWTGVIGRSRNLLINTQQIPADKAPRSVFALTSPEFKGKVAMASIQEGGVRLWLASLLTEKGEEATVKFINDLKNNGLKVLSNHTEVTQAVSRGEFPVGLVNHYYYVIEKGKNPAAPLALVYPDQGPNEIGTLVTPLAVGVIKGAKNEAQAKAFVDFALGGAGQAALTTQEQEFPLVAGAPLSGAAAQGVKTIDEIKRPKVDMAKLSEAEKRAVELFTPVLSPQ